MKPEQKCVSLETAKRLKEAGFPQDTERWWRDGAGVQLRNHNYPQEIDTSDYYQDYAAPDSQEIGELLPPKAKPDADSNSLPIEYWKDEESCVVAIMHYDSIIEMWRGKNEAEARAACWLFLKEKGLI